jgi:hypothetical protein
MTSRHTALDLTGLPDQRRVCWAAEEEDAAGLPLLCMAYLPLGTMMLAGMRGTRCRRRAEL